MRDKYIFTRLFINAILAGISISLGGIVFLKVKDLFCGANIVGAFLFSIGLFVVCTREYSLFTGKLCYLICDNNKLFCIQRLLVIWIGNFVGCMFTSLFLHFTSLCGGPNGIDSIAFEICQSKLSNSILSLMILGFFCNMFIFIAVDGYKNNRHQYLSIFLSVVVFILTGTEHSIADMFYFCVSNMLYASPLKSLSAIFAVTFGNIIGGIFIPVLEDLREKLY